MSRKRKEKNGELNIVEPNPTGKAIRKIRSRIRNVRDIKSFLFRLIILVAFIGVVFFGLFGLYAVPNDEMVPRVSPGDLVLYFRYDNTYLADDVIIYQAGGKRHIGRIVAAGGDTVEVLPEGGLYINDNYKVEKEIYFDTYTYEDYVEYPVTLE